MARFNVHHTRMDGQSGIRTIIAETPADARKSLLQLHPGALITKIKCCKSRGDAGAPLQGDSPSERHDGAATQKAMRGPARSEAGAVCDSVRAEQ